jgi:sterol 14-demethylase
MALEALMAGTASPLMLVGCTLAALAVLVIVRLLSNSMQSSRPPVFEGLPFVGGLMKFAGVS